MTPANLAGQFGDTTYTKVFVGGLAWETQKETMKKYFEQFGEILEAVVITDKATGRSKGYGFVTFREPEAAMRACVDAAPVIDGRRANCNLASLGVQRSKPSTPKNGGGGGGGGGGGRNFRVMGSFQTGFGGAVGTAFPSAATFPHYAIQQGIPYNLYGYVLSILARLHLPYELLQRVWWNNRPISHVWNGASWGDDYWCGGSSCSILPISPVRRRERWSSCHWLYFWTDRLWCQLPTPPLSVFSPQLSNWGLPTALWCIHVSCTYTCLAIRRDHGSSCTNSSSLDIHVELPSYIKILSCFLKSQKPLA